MKNQSSSTGILARQKISTQYLLVLCAVITVFTLSFILTNRIAQNTIRQDSVDLSTRVFQQTTERIDTYCRDLETVLMTLIYNPTLTTYMTCGTPTERMMMSTDINRVIANARQLKSEIAQVSLYDDHDKLIVNNGTVFIDKSQRPSVGAVFDGPYAVANQNNTYFSIELPVYDLETDARYEYLGVCFVVINAKELSQLLQIALVTQDAYISLTNQHGNTIIDAGVKPLEDAQPQSDITYESTCDPAKWTLRGVIPKSSLFGTINLLQKINFITYVMVFLTLLLLLILLYRGIIKPVRQLVAFMRRHGEYPKERADLRPRNEIGLIAENMNHMLNDIDALSEENYVAQRRVFESEYARKQTELLAYRNQINPHFLYNTFECIRGMALFHGTGDIANISEALSNLYRYGVKGDGRATLKEELNYVQEYARIIGYRFGGKHKVSISMDPSLDRVPVPKMLIQPIVENAVFHGLESRLSGGEVRVDVSPCGEDRMRVSVSDNGGGMSEDQLSSVLEGFRSYEQDELPSTENHGIGLMNIYRRIRLFYGAAANIDIQSEQGVGTTIVIELPKE